MSRLGLGLSSPGEALVSDVVSLEELLWLLVALLLPGEWVLPLSNNLGAEAVLEALLGPGQSCIQCQINHGNKIHQWQADGLPP